MTKKAYNVLFEIFDDIKKCYDSGYAHKAEVKICYLMLLSNLDTNMVEAASTFVNEMADDEYDNGVTHES